LISGQKKAVNVYRFVSKDSIEEDIIDRAKRKMVLEYSIISTMDTSGDSVMKKKGRGKSSVDNPDKISSEELQMILKFGAQNLFKNEKDKKDNENAEGENTTEPTNKLEEMNLDDILSRAEVHQGVEQSGTALGSAEFLTQFNVADVAQLSWDELIPEDLRESNEGYADDEIPEELLADSRRRVSAPVNYTGAELKSELVSKKKRKVRSGFAGDENTLSDKEKRALIRALLKYGDSRRRFDDIVKDADLANKDLEMVKAKLDALKTCCRQAVANETNQESKSGKPKMISVTFEGITSINAGLMMQRIQDLEFLNVRMEKQNLSSYRITWALKPVTNWSVPWGSKEDAMLLVGLYKHGYGAWGSMQTDTELPFAKKFFLESGSKQLPAAIHLQRRADFLLKGLREAEGMKYSKERQASRSHKMKSSSDRVAGKRPVPKGEKETQKNEKISKKPEVEVSDYESMDEKHCKVTLKPVRANLKALADPASIVKDKKEITSFIKENLVTVGQYIIDHLDTISEKEEQRKQRKHLWKYASYFWPTDIPSRKYRMLFSRMLEATIDDQSSKPKSTSGSKVSNFDLGGANQN
jgi:chromodomain-helicase-DNA-binding protein 1